MARAVWSGYISFGLVNVAVKLYTAVRSHDIHFRQLNEETLHRVRRKRVDEMTGEEVAYDEIVKGYEVDHDEYVVVDPDELEKLDPEASRMIDLKDFVDLADIDPVYYDRPYYLAPADEAASRPYQLLVDAMDGSARVGIAKFVMRTKEYLAAIRVKGGVLVLSTMNYADEIVPVEDIEDLDFPRVEVNKREVAMAEQLIDTLAAEFVPERYRDEYQQRVLEFLERKAAGEEAVVSPARPEPAQVVDLMAALEGSLRGRSRRAARDYRQRYEEMRKDELYELARQRDIPGRSRINKEELIEALVESDLAPGGRAAAG